MSDDPDLSRAKAQLLGCLGFFGCALFGAVILTAFSYLLHLWRYGSSAEWWGLIVGPPTGAVVGAVWYGLLQLYLWLQRKRGRRLPHWRWVISAFLVLLLLCLLPLALWGYLS